MRKPIYTLFIFCVFAATVNFSYGQTTYTSYDPCAFSVKLPADWSFADMYPKDDNPDVCDWQAKLKNGSLVLSVSATLASRFECYGIDECYQNAVNNSELNISYKTKQKTFFVISGSHPTNKTIVYWKRVFGEQFIADLYFEYTEAQKTSVEPFIGDISKSFKSD